MSLLLLFNQNLPGASALTDAVNRADWAKVEERIANNPRALEAITNQIAKLGALLDQANLTNAERAQAVASFDAVKSLVHAPKPEWKTIVTVLSGPTITALCNLASIAAVVASIIRMIVG